MAKKRKAEDPNAPPKPKWTPPKDDPMWEDYMKDCLYDGYEMHLATSPQLLPSKLPWPFKQCPDRSKLSKNAEAALVRAIGVFENRLSAVENALPIRELVQAEEREIYDDDSKDMWGRRGYLIMLRKTKVNESDPPYYRLFLNDGRTHWRPVYNSYSDDAYKPLLDFHLPAAAFKVFESIVSQWPGCNARRCDALTDAEKKHLGFKCKTAICLTEAAISREACEAFIDDRVEKPTESQLTAKKHFEERVRIEGPPKGFDLFRVCIPNEIASKMPEPAPEIIINKVDPVADGSGDSSSDSATEL